MLSKFELRTRAARIFLVVYILRKTDVIKLKSITWARRIFGVIKIENSLGRQIYVGDSNSTDIWSNTIERNSCHQNSDWELEQYNIENIPYH